MTITEALERTLADGGGTFAADTLEPIANGPWAVGGGIPGSQVHPRDLVGFGLSVDALVSAGAVTIGTWVDDGTLYVDAVDLIDDTDAAIRLAASRGELAIYHLTNKVTLEVSAVTCGPCGNILTVADAGTVCAQCRRSLYGGRAPKVRRASEYERAEYARRRKAGTL